MILVTNIVWVQNVSLLGLLTREAVLVFRSLTLNKKDKFVDRGNEIHKLNGVWWSVLFYNNLCIVGTAGNLHNFSWVDKLLYAFAP